MKEYKLKLGEHITIDLRDIGLDPDDERLKRPAKPKRGVMPLDVSRRRYRRKPVKDVIFEFFDLGLNAAGGQKGDYKTDQVTAFNAETVPVPATNGTKQYGFNITRAAQAALDSILLANFNPEDSFALVSPSGGSFAFYNVNATIYDADMANIATATPGAENTLKAAKVKDPHTFNIQGGKDYYNIFPAGFTGQKITTEPSFTADEVEDFDIQAGAKVKVYLAPRNFLFSVQGKLWMLGDPASTEVGYRVPHVLSGSSGQFVGVQTKIAGRLFANATTLRGQYRGADGAGLVLAWRGEARDHLTYMQATGLVLGDLSAQVSGINTYYNNAGAGATHGNVDYIFDATVDVTPVCVNYSGKLLGVFVIGDQTYYVWQRNDSPTWGSRPIVQGYASNEAWHGMRPEGLYTGTDYQADAEGNPFRLYQS